ncbi:MAG: hypothetical protein ACRDNY_05415 [Gaiellaceae bacterium]
MGDAGCLVLALAAAALLALIAFAWIWLLRDVVQPAVVLLPMA